MTTTTPRLMAKHRDQRLAGSVFHAYEDCVRLAPALDDDNTYAIEVNDQTVELLGLKPCADCTRRSDADPTEALRESVLATVTDDGNVLASSFDFDIEGFLHLLDGHGFEVRRKPKPRTSS